MLSIEYQNQADRPESDELLSTTTVFPEPALWRAFANAIAGADLAPNCAVADFSITLTCSELSSPITDDEAQSIALILAIAAEGPVFVKNLRLANRAVSFSAI